MLLMLYLPNCNLYHARMVLIGNSNERKMKIIKNIQHLIIICFLSAIITGVLFYNITTLPAVPYGWTIEATFPLIKSYLVAGYSYKPPIHWVDNNMGWASSSPLFYYYYLMVSKLFNPHFLILRYASVFLFLFMYVISLFIMRKTDWFYGFLFVGVLISSSPWFLVLVKYPFFVGFSLAFLMPVLALLYYRHQHRSKLCNRNKFIISLLTGIGLSILTYCYAPFRLVPFFIFIGTTTTLCFNLVKRKFPAGELGIYLGLLLCIIPQSTDLKTGFKQYFHARSESIQSTITQNDAQKALRIVKQKMVSNFKEIYDLFFKIDKPGKSYRMFSLVYNKFLTFPPFLIPFFIPGIIISLYRIKTTINIFMLILFFIGFIPCLAAVMGGANNARLILCLIPSYFFILESISYIVQKAAAKTAFFKTNSITIIALLITIISLYQAIDFYNFYTKIPQKKDTAASRILDYYIKNIDSGNLFICLNRRDTEALFQAVMMLPHEDLAKIESKVSYIITELWPHLKSTSAQARDFNAIMKSSDNTIVPDYVIAAKWKLSDYLIKANPQLSNMQPLIQTDNFILFETVKP